METYYNIRPWINFKASFFDLYKVKCSTRTNLSKTMILSMVFLLFSSSLKAQNKRETTHSAENISKVIIDGNQIFNIEIIATATNEIKINSLTDGEYQDDYQVFSVENDGMLNIELRRTPFYNTPDDKRNAHKVIAATLKIEMPKNLELSVISDIGSVILTGDFKALFVELAQGSFRAEAEAKFATINTMDGAIDVKTKDALIETDSKRGLVNIPNDMFGFNVWQLKTIGGNITVVKNE